VNKEQDVNVELRRDVLKRHILRRLPTQNSFALKARISSGYCAQLLSGKRKPSGKVRQRLMKVTGLSFDDLFLIKDLSEVENEGR